MKVLRLDSLATGGRTIHDGRFVVEYDPTILPDGSVLLETTPDRSKARKFSDASAALECWRQVSPNMPEDYPGHENRPLTAFCVHVEEA